MADELSIQVKKEENSFREAVVTAADTWKERYRSALKKK